MTAPETGGEERVFPADGRPRFLAPWGISRGSCASALRRVLSTDPVVEEIVEERIMPGVYSRRDVIELTVSGRYVTRGTCLVLFVGRDNRVDLWGMGPPVALDTMAAPDQDGTRMPWQVYRCWIPSIWLREAGGAIQLKAFRSLPHTGAVLDAVPAVYLITVKQRTG